jgi:hypothetical protein
MHPGEGFLLILFVALTACGSNNNLTPTPSGSSNDVAQQARFDEQSLAIWF